MVPVEGPQRSALISKPDAGSSTNLSCTGSWVWKRHGPLVAEAKIPGRDRSHPGPAPALCTVLMGGLPSALGTPEVFLVCGA